MEGEPLLSGTKLRVAIEILGKGLLVPIDFAKTNGRWIKKIKIEEAKKDNFLNDFFIQID